MEYEFNVLCVNSRREVVEESLGPFSSSTVEHLKNERLNILKVVRLPLELRKIVRNITRFDFVFQEISLVQKENNRDVREAFVIDNRFKYHAGLDETIRLSILHDHLVECARRDHEQDGCHFIKALEPLRALRPLPTDIDHDKGDALDLEIVLLDALRRFTGVQCILLCWHKVLHRKHRGN